MKKSYVAPSATTTTSNGTIINDREVSYLRSLLIQEIDRLETFVEGEPWYEDEHAWLHQSWHVYRADYRVQATWENSKVNDKFC